MDEGKAVDAPIRFFAIAYSDYEGYWETFILATSAEDALHRYQRYMTDVCRDKEYHRKETVDILAGELNDFGVMVSTDIIISDAVVEC